MSIFNSVLLGNQILLMFLLNDLDIDCPTPLTIMFSRLWWLMSIIRVVAMVCGLMLILYMERVLSMEDVMVRGVGGLV